MAPPIGQGDRLKVDIMVMIAIACGALWIERGHRVVIEAPAAADLGKPAISAGCPDTDTLPYSASCLAYLNVPAERGRLQTIAAPAPPMPCPDTDQVPYSASCIAFLEGATRTGMPWQAIDARPHRAARDDR